MASAIVISSCESKHYNSREKANLPKINSQITSISGLTIASKIYGLTIPDGIDPRTGVNRIKTVYATASYSLQRKLATEKAELKLDDKVIVIKKKQIGNNHDEFEIVGVNLPYLPITDMY